MDNHENDPAYVDRIRVDFREGAAEYREREGWMRLLF